MIGFPEAARRRRVRRALVAFAIPLAACGPGDGATADESGSSSTGVISDSVSLDRAREVVDAVTAPVLFERVAAPDPYLSDFFGIQVLQPVPAERVLADLVPTYAELVSREPHALTLDVTGGPRVVFRYDTRLVVNGNRVAVPWARVELREPASYPAEPARFREMLAQAGLAEAYLVANPYYAVEQVVALQMLQASSSIEPAPVRPDTAGFGASSHAVILVGETHGGTEAYDRALALLGSPSVEWIAIEMLSEDLQPALDAWLGAEPGTSDESRSKVLDYYRDNWNTRGHEVTPDPSANPYFRLIDAARGLGKPVYALDTEPSFMLFRFGEFPLGATVRDFVWASNIPPAGRGVVYGGSSHFLATRRPNMLTFLRERFPEIAIFEAGGR
jgi:hypothetical protein